MNELALFAGDGGSILAGELLGWRTVAAVECDAYCVATLLHRQQEGSLAPVPIWDDIRTFDGRPFRGVVDVVTAGFPCQPFSVAGRQRGADDSRNLWPETARILGEVRPRFALLENVPGLITSGYFGTVLGDFSSLGYDAEWCVSGARHVGAPHYRDRLWILAHTGRERDGAHEPEQESQRGSQTDVGVGGEVANPQSIRRDTRRASDAAQKPRGWKPDQSRLGQKVCHANNQRELQPEGRESDIRGWPGDATWWESEPTVGRVADGVAYRMERLRALGNGWVPSVAALAWRTLTSRLRAPQ